MVFGEGDVDSPMVLVGEAPGEQETIQQRPFVGKAGKNLEEFLDALEIQRGDLYITNVVKFRPFKINEKTGRLSNRPPTREEIDLSRLAYKGAYYNRAQSNSKPRQHYS